MVSWRSEKMKSAPGVVTSLAMRMLGSFGGVKLLRSIAVLSC